MAAALPFFTVLSIACIACGFTGIGVKAATLALPQYQQYTEIGLFWFFLFEVFYCVNIIPVKISIGLMLVRIAKNRKVYVYIQYGVMAMFTTMNVIACGFIIFHCSPVAAAWDLSLLQKGGRCNPQDWLVNVYYATTAVNIFTDWVTAFMPIPLLWNVKLNRNAKISVAGVLGLGFFASLSACVRLKYTIGLTEQENYLDALADIVIWGYAENGLGLIVGCMATLRPLFRRVFSLGGEVSTRMTGGGATGGKAGVAGGSSGGYGFPSNSRRTYEECDTVYEMKTGLSVTVGPGGPGDDSSGAGYGTHDRTANAVKKSRSGSSSGDDEDSFDTESQTRIIIKPHGRHGGSRDMNGGIMVTKQIALSRDDD
ncbi:uncharacterized protein B0I36DRAFT_282345 [Microdochium trichocladiopsis]|uniref:Rhodopsin domain-containing protein n=1 Tax=Microdochium trichocladiopsis TaxID=1682393 RepID=A0A9P9BWH3_9PEZI|nr:uncharacterized protein B0I36DRAFT_282345 [Microdochium trichocladiopsis]KAH7041413.1 hypothetical protein B0I36DRAFT_282345 [Microdochium trichocladiopsis]